MFFGSRLVPMYFLINQWVGQTAISSLKYILKTMAVAWFAAGNPGDWRVAEHLRPDPRTNIAVASGRDVINLPDATAINAFWRL
jgi:hypothetical protein